MADIRLSTLGIKVSYAIESVSGQRPSKWLYSFDNVKRNSIIECCSKYNRCNSLSDSNMLYMFKV